MAGFENMDRARFPGVGPYGIPEIRPVSQYPQGEFIAISDAQTEKRPWSKNIHCFVDDYRFVRCWNQPERYVERLRQFRAVCAPDFSVYTDMPVAMQIYNHYRKHWLAAYWQLCGMTVYPTISWSTPESYAWCFDGEPAGGIVAVSSVGIWRSKEAMRLFLQGYREMLRRLCPSFVIFCGKVPEECDWNVIRIRSHGEIIAERKRSRPKEQGAQVGCGKNSGIEGDGAWAAEAQPAESV